VRFMKARLWINEHNKIFAEMGKWVVCLFT
jgi:hypothetical protein